MYTTTTIKTKAACKGSLSAEKRCHIVWQVCTHVLKEFAVST